MKRLYPPLPQDDDKREFAPGVFVEAAYGFSASCPPRRDNIITKGTRGTVTGLPMIRDDQPFSPKRMVPVKWADGRCGEVGDRLLVLLVPVKSTHAR